MGAQPGRTKARGGQPTPRWPPARLSGTDHPISSFSEPGSASLGARAESAESGRQRGATPHDKGSAGRSRSERFVSRRGADSGEHRTRGRERIPCPEEQMSRAAARRAGFQEKRCRGRLPKGPGGPGACGLQSDKAASGRRCAARRRSPLLRGGHAPGPRGRLEPRWRRALWTPYVPHAPRDAVPAPAGRRGAGQRSQQGAEQLRPCGAPARVRPLSPGHDRHAGCQ